MESRKKYGVPSRQGGVRRPRASPAGSARYGAMQCPPESPFGGPLESGDAPGNFCRRFWSFRSRTCQAFFSQCLAEVTQLSPASCHSSSAPLQLQTLLVPTRSSSSRPGRATRTSLRLQITCEAGGADKQRKRNTCQSPAHIRESFEERRTRQHGKEARRAGLGCKRSEGPSTLHLFLPSGWLERCSAARGPLRSRFRGKKKSSWI